MVKAYEHLVKYCLDRNHKVSVWDGEEWQVKQAFQFRDIIGAIESVEIAQLNIRNSNQEKIGWALIVPYGVDPEETVADHTVTDFMEEWWSNYDMEYLQGQ